MAGMREITDGLRFPEGPIAMPDGSVVLVLDMEELFRNAPADTRISLLARAA